MALNPWGGSIVIFTEFWRTEIGNVPVGIEVSQSLNYLWVLSPNYSTIFYNSDIHEAAKWQFWSRIHVPFSYPDFTNYCAFGPCPCPRDIDYDLLSISLANLIKSVTGSEPGESKNIKGVRLVESL